MRVVFWGYPTRRLKICSFYACLWGFCPLVFGLDFFLRKKSVSSIDLVTLLHIVTILPHKTFSKFKLYSIKRNTGLLTVFKNTRYIHSFKNLRLCKIFEFSREILMSELSLHSIWTREATNDLSVYVVALITNASSAPFPRLALDLVLWDGSQGVYTWYIWGTRGFKSCHIHELWGVNYLG